MFGSKPQKRKAFGMQRRKTALLSAYDKNGLEDFANQLVAHEYDLLGSSGTAKYLGGKGIKVRDVAEMVGEPLLKHKVVTLSRELHAGLLATEDPEEVAELEQHGIPRIDLVYVNLYPLIEEIANLGHTVESVIEKTDIGGPTMLRSAAKGRRIVLCRPSEFTIALKFISGKYRDIPGAENSILCGLASIAEYVISEYCLASSKYLGEIAGSKFFNESHLI